MNASYELTRDDLAAFIEFHQRTSPAARRQKLGCFVIALAAMSVLPVGIIATADEPRLETAIDIWPLILGPGLFAILALSYIRWRTRQMSQRLLSEGESHGFYGDCELTLDSDGLTETRPSGSTTRKWSSVERISMARDHLFVYTSGIEAYVIPRRAFLAESEFNELAIAITDHSGVSIECNGVSNPLQ
jgi:hypothetical protein